MFFRGKSEPVSWLVVFLGNPGSQFNNTRHNVGFMVADAIENSISSKINRMKFNSLTANTILGGHNIFLIKPQTYMNLSGTAVQQAMSFFRIPLRNVIVVADDITLPVGKLRIRRSGSSGGHNGLKDIISKCGGDGFPRVKIGVGAPPLDDYEVADWVLSRFSSDDFSLINDSVKRAVSAIESIISLGIDSAMNTFN